MDWLLRDIGYLTSGFYILYSLIILSVYLFATIRLWFTYKTVKRTSNELEINPLVSIVIPAYNESESIIQCILSCRRQTYKNKEIIIVDDGSTDGTSDKIINRFKLKEVNGIWNNGIITLIITENRGKSAALNTAIQHAKGKWIATIDADTLLVASAIYLTIKYMRNNTDAVSSFVGVINENKIENGRIKTHFVPKGILPRIQWLEYIRCFLLWRTANDKQNACLVLPGAYSVIRKEFIQKVGGFKEGILSEDMELTMNMIKNGAKIQFLSKFLAWTEVPEKVSSLTKQRLRWYRGGVENLFRYKSMLFSFKRNGFIGFYMLPFLWFADVIGIWVELIGLINLFVFWLLDIPIEWNLVILSVIIIVLMYYISMILLVLFVKYKIFKNNKIKLYRVIPVILFEIISYHFLNLYWMIDSHTSHYFGKKKNWNKFARTGFSDN